MVNNPPAMQETWVRSLGWEVPPEEGVATHSSILAWRIPMTKEPGGLQSMGSQRVDMTELLSTCTHQCVFDFSLLAFFQNTKGLRDKELYKKSVLLEPSLNRISMYLKLLQMLFFLSYLHAFPKVVFFIWIHLLGDLGGHTCIFQWLFGMSSEKLLFAHLNPWSLSHLLLCSYSTLK